MKIFELLYIEESSRQSLYHSTNIGDALKIIHTKSLLAQTEHRTSSLIGGDKFKNKYHNIRGVSLTRSIHFGKSWKSDATGRFHGVVFELNWDKLREKHKILPMDYYGKRREAEEFVIGSITPIDSILTSIIISQDTKDWAEEQHEINPHYGYDLLLNHQKLKVI